MAYATVDQLDALLGLVSASEDPAYADGTPLASFRQKTLDSATEQIDRVCDRSFTLAADDPTSRTFTTYYSNSRQGSLVLTDDFAVVPTQVSQDGNVIEAEDWHVREQPKAGYSGQDIVLPTHFLAKNMPVEVTARWGWLAVPEPVVQACLLIAARLWERQKRPLGIATYDEVVLYIPRKDYAVMDLLTPYRRVGVV